MALDCVKTSKKDISEIVSNIAMAILGVGLGMFV
jgi:hypothetical protein